MSSGSCKSWFSSFSCPYGCCLSPEGHAGCCTSYAQAQEQSQLYNAMWGDDYTLAMTGFAFVLIVIFLLCVCFDSATESVGSYCSCSRCGSNMSSNVTTVTNGRPIIITTSQPDMIVYDAGLYSSVMNEKMLDLYGRQYKQQYASAPPPYERFE